MVTLEIAKKVALMLINKSSGLCPSKEERHFHGIVIKMVSVQKVHYLPPEAPVHSSSLAFTCNLGR